MPYIAHEYRDVCRNLPTNFSESQRHALNQEEDLIGYLVLGLPNGLVPNIPCTPFPIPLDMDFTGLKDVPFELPNDGALYYPSNAQFDFEQVQPLVFPDKWLHRTMEVI
jgi:hypothetical protein